MAPDIPRRSILVLGEAGVGKTCFGDMLCQGVHFAGYDPTDGGYSYLITAPSGTQTFVDVNDLNPAPILAKEPNFASALFEIMLRQADGFIFLYAINNERSYEMLTKHVVDLVCSARRRETSKGRAYPAETQHFGSVLVGNKLDVVTKDPETRRVRKEKAAEWASMHVSKHYEVDTFTTEPLYEVILGLLEQIEKAERRNKEDLGKCLEERWLENSTDMWGKKIEPWGQYLAVDEEKLKKIERGESVEEESGDTDVKKKRVSRSWSKLRNALPRLRSKRKTTTHYSGQSGPSNLGPG